MKTSWPVRPQPIDMLLRRIALVARDAVSGKFGVFQCQANNEPISRDLCKHRCRCHRDAVSVGLGLDLNRNRPQTPAKPVVRTIQNGYRRFVIRCNLLADRFRELPNCPGRGKSQTLGYAQGINLFVVGHADRPAGNPGCYGFENFIADLLRDQLGIGQFRGPAGEITGYFMGVPADLKNRYADSYRAEQGSAADLIDSDDESGTGVEERLLLI